MDRGMVIFVGSLLTLASSWLGLVVFPFWQLRDEPAYQKDAADDPERVTIFGESAGGRNVATLLVSDEARGLFQRAIIQTVPAGPE